jgi:ACS family tartrate transporter-like MFS transporter
VPANLLLHRLGARRWIARILISWGLVSGLTAFVTGPWSFYAVRILLGVAEAGFFPGIILYLTYWFPARERARVTAYFMTAIAFAGVFGNPLSGAIMQLSDGALGLRDWQWLFILEGLPSVLLGIVTLCYLPDRPEQARWLPEHERAWLAQTMKQEDHARQKQHGIDLRRALIHGRVWLLIGIYFTVAVGSNAAGSYFPELIRDLFPQSSKWEAGLLTAIPHVCAMVGMWLLGSHSDRTGERCGHLAFAALLAGSGWTLALFTRSPWLVLAGFCLAQTGMMSMLPVFWSLPTSFLGGVAAAGGIALINSVANIGGLLGPNILGWFGLPAMGTLLAAGGLLALAARQEPLVDRAP